jgi:hypothetical protein
MAQAVSRRPLTEKARVRSLVGPCGICGGQSGTGTQFSPCQFHSTGAPLQGETKKIIIFITGLHNKLQGCGASVATAAGSFKKKSEYSLVDFPTGFPSPYVAGYRLFSVCDEGPSHRSLKAFCATPMTMMKMSSFFYQVLQLMEHQWNEIDRGKLTTRRKTCPSATLSTTNLTWT